MREIAVIIGCLGDCRGVTLADIVRKKAEKEDDPEHDPLKTIPASPEKPSPIKKIVVGSVAAVAVIVIIVGGVFVVRAKKEAQQESAAIAMCEKRAANIPKRTKS